MDPPDRTVDSGGGAVFQGDITAGRDITINQITEIRQVAEHLSSRCNETNNSHKLLSSLEALSVFAKYTEDYANTLDTSVFSSDLHFGRVSEECASILRELKLLVETLEQGELGGYEPSPSFGDNVLDLRSRLTSLQSHLNIVSNRKAQKDYNTIKETLTQLVNSLTSTDKAFSIRSFVTAPSIRSFPTAPSIRSFVTAPSIRSFDTAPENPYVERQVWLEIERSLRAVGFTTEFVGKNRDLIVASLEDVFLENTPDWIVEEAKPEFLPLRLSEAYNIAITENERGEETNDGALLRSAFNKKLFTETDGDGELNDIASIRSFFSSEEPSIKTNEDEESTDGASFHSLYNEEPPTKTEREKEFNYDRPLSLVRNDTPSQADKSGVTWSRLVEGGSGECLLTLDGGGVKSWSSLLIIEELMKEVIACENRFERQFTQYPRSFEASEFRPCHYFHKMYGTSTGGILAIALSRLRMNVGQTIVAFESILNAMYANSRNVVPLATKYSHSDLTAALASMTRQHCKQHERGLCNRDHDFWWGTTGLEDLVSEEELDDPDDSDDSDDANSWTTRRDPMESKLRAFELQSPEYQLCQTICVTAISTRRWDETHLLRTYNHQYDPSIAPPWVTTYNEGTSDMSTWQVGRATTATPFFFKPLEVKGPHGSSTFKDGGIRENNPSYCAYSEAASVWGDENEPAILLSIGTGQTRSISDGASLAGIIPFGLSTFSKYAEKAAVVKNSLIKYMESEDRHKMMRTIAKGEHRWYKRFEVTDGLEKLPPDQWELGIFSLLNDRKLAARPGGRTLSKIRTATNVYLNRQEIDKSLRLGEYAAPHQKLKQTAEKLVRMRRARELEAMTQGGEKREHWEAFMGKHLIGERDFFRKYQEEWDYALLGRKN